MSTTAPPSVSPDPPVNRDGFPWGFVARLACVLLVLAPAFLIARDRYDVGVLDAALRAPVLTFAIVADWILPSDWTAWVVSIAADHPVGWTVGTGLLSIWLWFKILVFL